MTTSIKTEPIETLLKASAASEPFKAAVRDLQAGKRSPLIASNAGAPPVKVLRFISKLIEVKPELPIESLEMTAASGCSDFRGTATIEPGPVTVDFVWDCAWRAQQQGWNDAFGDPDQIRAARELGYQCFEKFEVRD